MIFRQAIGSQTSSRETPRNRAWLFLPSSSARRLPSLGVSSLDLPGVLGLLAFFPQANGSCHESWRHIARHHHRPDRGGDFEARVSEWLRSIHFATAGIEGREARRRAHIRRRTTLSDHGRCAEDGRSVRRPSRRAESTQRSFSIAPRTSSFSNLLPCQAGRPDLHLAAAGAACPTQAYRGAGARRPFVEYRPRNGSFTILRGGHAA